MSERLEGVKDPQRVDPSCENAVVEGWPYRGPQFDTIYRVDAEGYLRDDGGDPVPWVGPGVIATDVDAETWGEHYHNPADCPTKDLPTHRPERRTCDDCTPAVERDHDRDHYRPDKRGADVDAGEVRKRLREAVNDLPDADDRPVMLATPSTADALQEMVDKS